MLVFSPVKFTDSLVVYQGVFLCHCLNQVNGRMQLAAWDGVEGMTTDK